MHKSAIPYEDGGLGSTAHITTDTRLSGWRLTVARVAALAVAAVTMGLGAYALVLWPRLAIPCEDALSSCLLTPEQVVPLNRLGITPLGLTFAIVVFNCVAIALANGVAAVLFWRRSDDAMALLVAVTLVLLPAFFTPMYIPLSGVWHTAATLINRLGGISFLLLLGLFPNGRFAPRWVWLPILALGMIGSGSAQMPGAVVLPIVLGAVVSLIGAQIYRYRSVSTLVQRQQTKWAVAGLILAILVNQLFWQPEGWSPMLQRKDSLFTLLVYPDFAMMISILAVSFGIAILRYRLYDIDVVIRQTLVYGALTAILAALYFGIVIGMQIVTQRLTGVPGQQQPIVIVATTLLIAALFAPLRRRIQSVIDRAFYRSKYDAALTLTAFGAKMREETDLGTLCDEFVEVVEQTMQPAHVSLWLHQLDQHPRDQANRRDVLSEATPAAEGNTEGKISR